MSRSPHMQSPCRLRKLPRCSRCKDVEFVLVCAMYDTEKGTELKYEWECPSCRKAVPREFLKEESPVYQDSWLHKWCLKNQEELEQEKKHDRRHRRERSPR